MLEQQIETLAEHVGTLDSRLDTTNALLADILTAIRDGGSLPPAPAKVAGAKSAKGKAKVEAVAKEDADEDPTQEAGIGKASAEEAAKTATPADPVNIEDVREALMAVRDSHGREAAVAIVERFSGGTHKVSDIPESKYPDVLAACDGVDHKEAA